MLHQSGISHEDCVSKNANLARLCILTEFAKAKAENRGLCRYDLAQLMISLQIPALDIDEHIRDLEQKETIVCHDTKTAVRRCYELAPGAWIMYAHGKP